MTEVPITVFTSRRKADHATCRLVVRRVKRLQPLATDGTQQGERFAAHRHHEFITDSTLGTVEADQRHRDHAVVEQVIAELKDGPIAHLPSGSHAANAGWLPHAVIAFSLARTAGVLALQMTRPRLLGHPARPPDQLARPGRHVHTTTHPPPTSRLALRRCLADTGRSSHRTTRHDHHQLTLRPNGHNQGPTWKHRTDRSVSPCPPDDADSETTRNSPRNQHRSPDSPPVDQGPNRGAATGSTCQRDDDGD